MQNEVVWSALQWPAVEHVAFATGLDPAPDGWAAHGAMVGVVDGLPTHLLYRLVVGQDGGVREVDIIDNIGGAQLELRGDGAGHWFDADGAPVHALDGCVDVDISTTPLTNTLPIRRLRLSPGRSGEVKVAYIDVPSLTVEAANQRYTRVAASIYRYESGDFAAEVTVDEDDLVTEYSGFWRRIPTLDRIDEG
jgi:uncharacterized protein